MSTNIFITSNDIIESAKKNNCVLCLEKNANSIKSYMSNKVHYIPILFKTADGNDVPLNFNFKFHLLGSGALQPKSNDNQEISNFYIIFRNFSEEELNKNNIIKKKARKTVKDNMIKNIKAIEIIYNSFIILSKKIVATKDKKNKIYINEKKIKLNNDNISKIKQSTYEKENETLDLEFPLYRIKLKVDKLSGKIGKCYKGKKFNPTIFSYNKKKKIFETAFYNDSNGIKKDVDIYTVKNFVTYGSLTFGTISFRNIIISTQGISLGNEITKLCIKTNKNNKKKIATQEETKEFSDLLEESSDSNTDESEIDKVENENNSDSENNSDNEDKNKNEKESTKNITYKLDDFTK